MQVLGFERLIIRKRVALRDTVLLQGKNKSKFMPDVPRFKKYQNLCSEVLKL